MLAMIRAGFPDLTRPRPLSYVLKAPRENNSYLHETSGHYWNLLEPSIHINPS